MKDYRSTRQIGKSTPRIAHLTSAHQSTDTRIFFKECRSLAKAGFQIHLVAQGKQDELRDQIQIHSFPIAKNRLTRITIGMYQIFRIAKGIDADIFHIHDPDLIFLGLFLLNRGKKVIYDVHEDNPRNLLSRQYLPIKVRKPISLIYEKLEDYAAKNFSAIVAATSTIGQRFKETNSKIVVVNNYPIFDELKPVSTKLWKERDISVSYVGAITYVRGGLHMVQAMEYIPKEIGVSLDLAGRLTTEVRSQAMEFKGWQSVRYLGLLSREEVKDLLARTRAGLVLFQPEPNHIQAQPTKMFEYMSASIPVIASDFPLWRKIIENTGCGLLVDPMDVYSIADSIRIILMNDKEAETMGKRGREAVEAKYNWGTEEGKLIELYKEVLQ
jgi:glycosyltransferase involved in cell wall biosynthesis